MARDHRAGPLPEGRGAAPHSPSPRQGDAATRYRHAESTDAPPDASRPAGVQPPHGDAPSADSQDRGDLRILFCAANPARRVRLALREELDAVRGEIIKSRHADRIELIESLATSPLDLVRELLRAQPDILHISGHGAPDGNLVLLGTDGGPHEVSPAALARLLEELETRPSVVILNACFSAVQGAALSSVIDVVIGLPDVVEDRYAVVFSSVLYMSLCQGLTVEKSLRYAIGGVNFNFGTSYWQFGEPILRNRIGTTAAFSVVRRTDPSPAAPSAAVLSARMAQQRLAERLSEQQVTRTLAYLNDLEFFLVPMDGQGHRGFWATRQPLAGPLAERLRAVIAPAPAPEPWANGCLAWHGEAALAAATALCSVEPGLSLPAPDEAAVLRGLAARGPDECRRLRWSHPHSNFWVAAPSGAVVPSDDVSTQLPLLLVLRAG